MKKKILSILTNIFLLSICIFSFTACNESVLPHTHEYDTLKSNASAHWLECDCGEKQGVESHKGGTATETSKAICEVCGKDYGLPLTHIHNYNTLKNDGTNHWHECTCGEKQGIEAHKGGTATETSKAICLVCNQEYGSILEHSHTFTEQVVQNKYLKEQVKCESKAQYYYTCKCGKIGTTWFEYGEKLDHSYTNYIYNNDAKCEQDGTETAVCNNGCGESDTRTKTGTALNHKFVNYASNNDATCTKNGTKTAKCENKPCTKTDTIEDLGTATNVHSYGEDGCCTICKTAFNNQPTEGVLYFVPSGKNYAVVLGYEGTSKRVVIADTYNNLPVKEIGEEAFYQSNITHIVIPEGVEIIADSAFQQCANLISVSLPNSITSIGSSAFANCSNLEIVNLPKQLIHVGYIAFRYTKTYYNNNNWVDNVLYIDDWVVDSNASILGFCSIKDDTVGICDGAFFMCKKITNLVIPNSVTSIGDYAFSDSPIQTAVVPINIFQILEKNSLKNVTITKADEIKFGAFKECVNIESLTLPFVGTNTNNYKHFGYLFGAESHLKHKDFVPKSLKQVVVKGGIIVDYAFMYCENLTTLTMLEDVESIGTHAFYKCTSLNEVTFSQNITKICWNAFAECISLKSIVLPNAITLIDVYAFDGCENLTSVIMPNSVTRIEYRAFGNCLNLKYIIYDGTIEDWNAIKKMYEKGSLTATVKCIDGEIKL